ncbi:outer membrane beta-barrel protein [Vibrio pelagius]|uniref:outer membrane beta-barrel protein n=1 Tax=Vibrio pelagius TaxID=28169 RepID=UPI0035500DA4
MSIWKLGLVSVCAAFSFEGMAQDNESKDLDFNYVTASVYSGSLNADAGGNNNASVFGLGVSYELTDKWLLVGDYTARFIHPDESTTRIDTLMGGAGYRFNIRKDLDIVASYLLGVTKGEVELNSNNQTLESDTEFIHGGKLDVNYGFAKRWVANGSIQANRSGLFDEEIYHLGLRYKITSKFSIEGAYQHRNGDSDNGGERTNELGLAFRLEY